MRIQNAKTGQIITLEIIDLKTGVNFIDDFIAPYIDNEEFNNKREDEEGIYYVMNGDDFDWWVTVIKDNQALDYRIYELEKQHGYESVQECVTSVDDCDLEHRARIINDALDEKY
jgi:hypothetical protein